MKTNILLTVLLLTIPFLSCKKNDAVPAPTANFSFSEIATGDIQFTNLSKNANTYNWDFGDGYYSTASANVFLHHFPYNGDYKTKLTVSNSAGQAQTYTQNVSVTTAEGFGVFYLRADTKHGLVTVTMTDTKEAGAILQYISSGLPTCTDPNFFRIKRRDGVYDFTATTADKVVKWAGQINVKGGACSPQLLNL